MKKSNNDDINLINKEGTELRKLQLVEVEILDEIVRLCNKHNLQYFLMAGTCLGAIRHSGFIPWDDDIDIAMPREDYEKFLDIALDELDKKYFLQYYKTDKDYYLGFAKVRKNNTTFVTEGFDKKKGHQGFFVDIFPIDYNTNADSKILKLEVSLARCIIETLKYKNGNLYFKHLRRPWLSILFIPFTNRMLQRIVNWLYKLNNKKEHKYAAIYSNIYHYRKDIYPFDKVFPGKNVTFEGKEYTVYQDYDFYLTQLYGDYMTIPKKENRVAHKSLKLFFDEGVILDSRKEYDKLNK